MFPRKSLLQPFAVATGVAALLWMGCSSDSILSSSPGGEGVGEAGTADFGTPTGTTETSEEPGKTGRPEGWNAPFDILTPIDDIISELPELPEIPPYVPDVGWDGGPLGGDVEKRLLPDSGGRVECSIATLDVPPGSFKTDTDFRIEIPDDDDIRIRLYPHGIEFSKPVTLTLDLSAAAGLGKHVALFWFDEEAGEWVNVGGKYDPKTRILTTKLGHFSDYAPGRAGWRDTGPEKPSDTKPGGGKKPKGGTK